MCPQTDIRLGLASRGLRMSCLEGGVVHWLAAGLSIWYTLRLVAEFSTSKVPLAKAWTGEWGPTDKDDPRKGHWVGFQGLCQHRCACCVKWCNLHRVNLCRETMMLNQLGQWVISRGLGQLRWKDTCVASWVTLIGIYYERHMQWPMNSNL